MKADTRCAGYKTSLACALGKASHLGNDVITGFLASKGAEVGFWSQATVNPCAGRSESLQVTFKETSTVRTISAEDARVIALTNNTMSLTLRFRLRSRP
jgi:hypothetical protein